LPCGTDDVGVRNCVLITSPVSNFEGRAASFHEWPCGFGSLNDRRMDLSFSAAIITKASRASTHQTSLQGQDAKMLLFRVGR
jgi:hypothetical protein